jgi:hypothetical protein
MFRVHSSPVPVVMVCRPTHRDASIHRLLSLSPTPPYEKGQAVVGLALTLPYYLAAAVGVMGHQRAQVQSFVDRARPSQWRIVACIACKQPAALRGASMLS